MLASVTKNREGGEEIRQGVVKLESPNRYFPNDL